MVQTHFLLLFVNKKYPETYILLWKGGWFWLFTHFANKKPSAAPRAFYCCKMCKKSKLPPFLYYKITFLSYFYEWILLFSPLFWGQCFFEPFFEWINFFEPFFEPFLEGFFSWALFWALFWGFLWGLFSLSPFLSHFLRAFLTLFGARTLGLMMTWWFWPWVWWWWWLAPWEAGTGRKSGDRRRLAPEPTSGRWGKRSPKILSSFCHRFVTLSWCHMVS